MEENENGNAQRFLELIRRSRRGNVQDLHRNDSRCKAKLNRMLSEAI